MTHFYVLKGLIIIGIWIAAIRFVSGWQETKSKTLLFGFVVLMAVSSIGFFLLGPVNSFIDSDMLIPYDLRKPLQVILHLVSLGAAGCLLGYIIEEGRQRRGIGDSIAPRAQQPAAAYRAASPGRDNPYYGVYGWLKFVVVVYIYVAPALFVLGQLASWAAYVSIASRYPGVIVSGLISTGVWGYLVYRGINVGKGLRDLRPRAVQDTRKFLVLCLVWTILGIPVSFISGLETEWLVGSAVRTLIASGISFAIWYSYFNVSRRVEATYPDWKDRMDGVRVATPGSS